MMGLTKKQLKVRRTGVTSTDIGAICSLNSFRSAMEVYLEKIGKPIEHEQTEAQYWGLLLEPVLLGEYGKRNQVKVYPNKQTLVAVETWMLCTPDAFIGKPPLYGLEVKTAGSARQVQRWGEAGDEVPEEYLVQAAWCMAVMDLERWDIAVLLATWHGFEYRQYTLKRDMALENRLIELGREFWFGNVAKRIPPAPDGSASAAAALRVLYPGKATDFAMADSAEAELLDEYFGIRDQREGLSAEEELLKQRIMALIGDAEGIEDTEGNYKITFKPNKKGARVWRPWSKGEEVMKGESNGDSGKAAD